MHMTDCSGETTLVLHVPSSSWAGSHNHHHHHYFTTCPAHTWLIMSWKAYSSSSWFYVCLLMLQAGATEHARELGGKGSDAHKAAVIGDTVGDPLKDTSGPSLNILIKLMAVESLVFAPFFKAHTRDGLIFQYFSTTV